MAIHVQRGAKIVGGVLGVVATAGIAFAEPPEGDVFLEVANGQMRTGFIAESGDPASIDRSVRVFYVGLGEDLPNEIEEPGFQSIPGGLGSLTEFGFNIRQALRKWNGADFSTIPSETMSLIEGSLSVTTPASDIVTPGFSFANDPSGSHDHPTFLLNAPASNGIYLLELEFTGSGVQTSDKVWMLFGQNADAASVDAAYAWGVANVPSPSAAGLLGLAGVLAARRRRA